MTSLITRFRDDCRGTTALMFGLLLVPVVATVGAAVDYTRAADARTAMQAAADTAALAVARDAGSLSDNEITDRARAVFAANFHKRGAVIDPLVVEKTDRVIRVSATGSVKTAIMGIINVDEIKIGSTTQVAWGRNKLEIALVLDNTGSMARANKMPALKTAVHDFLTTLQNAAYDRDAVKISIVPFDTQVNIGTGFATADWLTFNANLGKLATDSKHWQGCVSDRDAPFDTQDGGQSGPAALYPAADCADASLATLQPLTNDFDALRRSVDSMQPSGNTNITIGVAWGLASLSPAAPLDGGVTFGTPGVDKIMIVLTDGDNTQNRTTSKASEIDTRTRMACKTAKDAGIGVYTIRVIEGNVDLLRGCASDPGNYHEVANANELEGVFQGIAGQITRIRLTN
jgi:Flp pilus assembly protein TadG